MLTDPHSEALADMSSSEATSSADSGPDVSDEALETLQQAEAAVNEAQDSYDAHLKVTISLASRKLSYGCSVLNIKLTVSVTPRVPRACWNYLRNRSPCVQLVNLLGAHNLRQRQRSARIAFAARFPLPEDVWQTWLQSELQEFEQGRIDADTVVKLAQQAVEDYLSVPLWCLLLQCAPVLACGLF